MNTSSPSTATLQTASFVALRAGFWRVVHPAGHVLGYIELGYIEENGGGQARQFTARRLLAGTTRLIDIGDFRSIELARACFA